MIDKLPSPIRPPGQPNEGNLASRIVFGRSGFDEEARKAGRKGGATGDSGGESGAAPTDAEQPQPTAEAQPAEPAGPSGAESAKEAFGRKEAAFSVPGIERPPFDRAVTDQAWQTMQATARMAPPTASDVKAAMGQFSPETQRGLASYQASKPDRMRQFAAQHVGAEGLTSEQRDALLTMGSAPRGVLAAGMNQAIASLDAPVAAAASAPPSDPALSSPSQSPPASASGGANDTAAPAGPPASPPAGAPQASPPSGSRSLGADMREQPSPGASDTSKSSVSDGLVDPEPFLE
jgi:hypothetical protein